MFVVPDASKEERFADNPLVTQKPDVRFYAGTPLVSSEGFALGTLCVIDRVPRELSQYQIEALTILGRQVVSLLNMRRAISVAHAVEAEMKLTVNRLNLATLSAKIGVWEWNLETNALTWDATMFEHYGFNPTDDRRVEYSDWASTVVPEDLAEQETILRDTIARRGRSEREFRIRRVDGALRVIHAAESVVLDENQRAISVVGVNQDVTESRLAEERIRHISLHDSLTGLPNRVLFADRVHQALLRLKRDPQQHFAVLFIDLDRFKVVNDGMGHAAGDVLLKTISDRLISSLRSTDTVLRSNIIAFRGDSAKHKKVDDPTGHTLARMGGDEFTLLLSELQKFSDATVVAQRILKTISQPITFDGHEIRMTASIGIVNGTSSYNNSQELLRDADSAMYRAKNAGKARYAVFDSTMHAAAVLRMQMESDLRQALERDQLVLYYQPILSAVSGTVLGFEALIRWPRVDDDGNITMINPVDFISIAEDAGLIVPLGDWVLQEASRQMAGWKHKHPASAGMTIAINVSGKQLVDDSFVGQLRAVLDQTRLDPKTIRLEITESVLLDERNNPLEKLLDLKSTGVMLAMDDFGTGHSSLSCLNRFPIDILKVDRSFVQNINKQRHAAAVVEAVITLAHNMGMTVVAEGVESLEQMALLKSLDCDLVQGFLFSKPLPAERAERFIETSRMLAQAG